MAPPVAKLLEDVLPTLPYKINTFVPKLPKDILTEVQSMVHQRNRLVHKGCLTVDTERVTAFLDIVHDILYYLDILTGSEWAAGLTSSRFRDWLQSEGAQLDYTAPLQSG